MPLLNLLDPLRVRAPPAVVVALVAASVALWLVTAALAQVSFRGPTNFAAGVVPFSVAVGDLDGDSDLDLAVANAGSDNVSVLLGDGAGGFGAATNFAAGDTPLSVAVADLDGDSDLDLAVANVDSDNVSVLLNNRAPSAAADQYTIAENTVLSVGAPGVLGNDSDPDADSLSATLVSGPAHGTLSLNADGSFGYTPAANFNGSDSFTYQASDGSLASTTATVTLTVNGVNDAPSALDDAYATDEDTALSVAAPGVLGNDTDPDQDSLSATLVTAPAHGTLSLNTDGSFAYTPAADFNGSDSFTYQASDGSLAASAALVSITVRATPPAPGPPPQLPPTAPPALLPDTVAPSAPTPLSGRLVRGTHRFVRAHLQLTWPPATDNVAVDHYLLRAGTPPTKLPATSTTTTIALRGAATYTLLALDAAGNQSGPATLTVTRRPRPEALQRRIPAWAWQLLIWRATPPPQRAARPAAAPRHVPAWYWTWATWRLNPYQITT